MLYMAVVAIANFTHMKIMSWHIPLNFKDNNINSYPDLFNLWGMIIGCVSHY